MPAPCVVDPGVLADEALKATLVELGRTRARLDAEEAAVIAEFDQRSCCVDDGMVNTRAWLGHHTGVARAVAGGRVRLARRLRRMPLMADALQSGSVTEGHARSLGRCLTPRTLEAFARDEQVLVDQAVGLEADDFDRVVTRWLFLNDPDGPHPGSDQPSVLHTSPLLGGRTRVDGELDLEDSVELLAELDALYDELWHADQAADDTDPLKQRTHAQRNAAALVEMARRSSATGDRDNDDNGDHHDHHRPVGARHRRPQLLAVVDLDALAAQLAGHADLEDGTPLPQTILQRWLCDSAIGRVVMAGPSVPIDLGHLTYTPSAPQRRALIARDRGCIVPGCKRKARWCDAHHVVPWPAGPTDLANLVLLCKRHHKHVHAGIIRLERNEQTKRWTITRPDGTPLRERPPPARGAA
jgi:hypothetical protein